MRIADSVNVRSTSLFPLASAGPWLRGINTGSIAVMSLIENTPDNVLAKDG